ncbi:MAG: DNA alkylation repair protein [Bacteroidales bacterium]|nr:DNA alkylation repair protein [Bacteroidales bacterium]
MKSSSELITETIEALNSLANHERKELAKTYYPTKMKVIGVINPDVKIVIKQLKPEIKHFNPKQNIQFSKDLVHTDIFECQQIGYELLEKNKKLLPHLSMLDVEQLDHNQDNWVSVDTYSSYILGVAWRLGIITDLEILNKTESSNFWIRRQALVATLGWNQKARGGTGNTEKTLMICMKLMDDHHDMINKALSWALRELTKTDRNSVIDFMEEYNDRLHGRVRREVWNKVNTGLKNPIL